jgi:hypothetical protein
MKLTAILRLMLRIELLVGYGAYLATGVVLLLKYFNVSVRFLFVLCLFKFREDYSFSEAAFWPSIVAKRVSITRHLPRAA